MTPEEEAKDFHLRVVAQARTRQHKHHDVDDPREFEQIMDTIELLGDAAVKAAKFGLAPKAVGRAMLYYAKCVANMTEGGAKGIVPEPE